MRMEPGPRISTGVGGSWRGRVEREAWEVGGETDGGAKGPADVESVGENNNMISINILLQLLRE